MKPWFEREAKVIKFPEPEKKVVQMPNVASYPDFITGVADLKARKDKREISQASHDKLYTDLIHRFMRKESFETPWFIKEAMVGTSTDASKYIPSIEKLFAKGGNFPVGGKPGKFTVDVKPGTKIDNGINTVIGQDAKGKDIKVGHLYKSDIIKGSNTASYNKGNVVEGIFGAGIYLALITPARSISESILSSFCVRSLAGQNGKNVKGMNTRTKDKVSLSVRLSPNNFAALTDSITMRDMAGEVKSVVDYVNGEEIQELEKDFANNGTIDNIQVIADGLSDENTSKVDVYVKYNSGVVKYERSVKTGNVKQFGQVTSGGGKDDLSMEERYDLQEEFWSTWGVSISASQKDFEDSETNFLDAYDFSYKVAAEELNKLFSTNKDEKNNIPEFIKTIQYHAFRDNPNAKMIKFTNKGYVVLDFKKLDDFVDKINLKAVYNPPAKRKTSSGDYVRARPEVHIVDQEGNKFISFRLNVQGADKQGKNFKKVTNLIEQGELLADITKVSTNIK